MSKTEDSKEQYVDAARKLLSEYTSSDEVEHLRTALWNAFQENATQFRHHETERSAVATAIVAIAAAIVGIITFDDTVAWPIDGAPSLFLVGLGIFGASFTVKQYERSKLHYERLRMYRAGLDTLLLPAPLQSLIDAADAIHKKKYPRMEGVPLHYWWVALHLLTSVAGAALLIMALCFPVTNNPSSITGQAPAIQCDWCSAIMPGQWRKAN